MLQRLERLLARRRELPVHVGEEGHPQEAQEVHGAPLRLPRRAQLGEAFVAGADQGLVLVEGPLVLLQQALQVGLDTVKLQGGNSIVSVWILI